MLKSRYLLSAICLVFSFFLPVTTLAASVSFTLKYKSADGTSFTSPETQLDLAETPATSSKSPTATVTPEIPTATSSPTASAPKVTPTTTATPTTTTKQVSSADPSSAPVTISSTPSNAASVTSTSVPSIAKSVTVPTQGVDIDETAATPPSNVWRYLLVVESIIFSLVVLWIVGRLVARRRRTHAGLDQITSPVASRGVILGMFLLAVISATTWQLSQRQLSADINPPVDKGKYVLGYGGFNPPVDYLRTHPEEIRKTGLDGIILSSRQWPTNPNGCCDTSAIFRMDKTVNDINPTYLDRYVQAWSSFIADTGLLTHSLQAVRLSTTTDTNITADVTDEQLQGVYDKWRLYVKTMIKAKIEGFWFDDEQSGTLTGFFDVPPVIDGVATNTLTADEQFIVATRYEQRVKEIGQRLSEITSEEAAGQPFNIMLYFGAGFASHDYISTRQQLLSNWDGGQHDELLPAFEAGLIKGAAANVVISETDFRSNKIKPDANNTVLTKLQRTRNSNPLLLKSLTDEPASVTDRIGVNEELWIDYNDDKQHPHPWYWQDDGGNWFSTNRHYDSSGVLQWDILALSPDQVQDNYYTPTEVTATLRDEITTTSRYAWVYSQTVDMFGWAKSLGMSNATPLGTPYYAALAAARVPTTDITACAIDVSSAPTVFLTGHQYNLDIVPRWLQESTGLTIKTQSPASFAWNKTSGSAVYTPQQTDAGTQTALFTMSDGVELSQCQIDLPTVVSKPVGTIDVGSDKTIIRAGEDVVFTVSITNNGNDTLKEGTIEIHLPDNLTLVNRPATLAIPDQEPNQTNVFTFTVRSPSSF